MLGCIYCTHHCEARVNRLPRVYTDQYTLSLQHIYTPPPNTARFVSGEGSLCQASFTDTVIVHTGKQTMINQCYIEGNWFVFLRIRFMKPCPYSTYIYPTPNTVRFVSGEGRLCQASFTDTVIVHTEKQTMINQCYIEGNWFVFLRIRFMKPGPYSTYTPPQTLCVLSVGKVGCVKPPSQILL